ncbi:hypothetical protein NDK43_16280 [Neobacillus pocheonensis]|jgi:hypothetical protein|uniref:Uncharacterized protein n=1 Tax=Neobacillus pocheonensis TaxID=363869 RepID=A0ABT0WBJ3_9BACI|nr:hypothetical protein [Neobacillus pocheonensis]
MLFYITDDDAVFRSMLNIQKSLSNVFDWNSTKGHKPSYEEKKITEWAERLISSKELYILSAL